MTEFLTNHVYSMQHWPFLAALVVFMIIGQAVKTGIFTKAQAAKHRKCHWFWWWAYKTLPLHPIVTGLLTGLVWSNPEPGISGIGAMFYFAGAGACSVCAFQILKDLLKKRGVDLTVPGASDPPNSVKPGDPPDKPTNSIPAC
jgi:hypothetical protein